MKAWVEGPGASPAVDDVTVPVGHDLEYQYNQDPETGEIVRVLVPRDVGEVDVTDVTPGDGILKVVPCTIYGIVSEGVSAAGATVITNPRGEIVRDTYLKMEYSARYKLTDRDVVVRIEDSNGNEPWYDIDPTTAGRVVFEVTGIIPQLDGFGRHISNVAMLKRSDSQ